MPTPDPRQVGPLPGISVREAANRLGVSKSTVERRIKDGTLDAGYYDRPGGTVLRVFLPAPEAPQATSGPPQPIETDPTSEPPQATPEPLQAVVLAQMDTIADLHAKLLDAYQQIIEARERAAAAEADARHAAADIRAASERASQQQQRADELARERDALAAALRRAEATLAQRRWWWPW